jgi:hypothetical protein
LLLFGFVIFWVLFTASCKQKWCKARFNYLVLQKDVVHCGLWARKAIHGYYYHGIGCSKVRVCK